MRFLLVLSLSFCIVACSKSKSDLPTQTQITSFAEFKKIEAETRTVVESPACTEIPGGISAVHCRSLRQEFRYVVYVGKQIYCYWEEKKLETKIDYDALAAELENSITDQTSFSDYYLALRRWASAFHDGHVNALAGEDLSQLEIYTSPVRLEVFAPATEREAVIVTALGDVRGNISPGDRVIEVNGKPVAQALAEAAVKATSGSTERMRRISAARRLVDVIGTRLGSEAFTLKVIHRGVEEIVNIPRKAELNLPPDPTKKPEEDNDASKYISASVMPGGIGYLKIDVFAGNMEKLIPTAMDRLQRTRALIIDMRFNGGGDQSGSLILSRLIEQKIARYKKSNRNSDYLLSQRPYYFVDGIGGGLPFAPWTDMEVEPAPKEKAYLGKPVVVLTATSCFSACDTFVAGLKANKLATVIGEPTGGGTGSPLVFTLPNSELQFRYSVVRGLTAKNEVIEGRGTSPDLLVEQTPEARFQGKDLPLEAALQFVSTQIRVPVPPQESRPVAYQPQTLEESPTKVENTTLKLLSRFVEY